MGKQKKMGLGKALKANLKHSYHPASVRHTTGSATKDFATLHSCTQESDLDSFLRTADLANIDFTAEKMNVKVINHQYSEAVPHPEEQWARQQAFLEHKHKVRIPRRPPWTKEMEKEELEQNERDAFITWRRNLAVIQENQHVILTPFEKNLEVWRQLWRVTERSDVIIQIVDARDPLFYWCDDLDRYVSETGVGKESVLLINKSDFLSDFQRQTWFEYFTAKGIKTIFYSAITELVGEDEEEEEESTEQEVTNEEDVLDEEERFILSNFNKFSLLDQTPSASGAVEDMISEKDQSKKVFDVGLYAATTTPATDFLGNELEEKSEETPAEEVPESEEVSSERLLAEKTRLIEKIGQGEILNNTELLTYLTVMRDTREFTIGLVGYPNVGKSCTLNSLLQETRVSVSSTPGKTKHFQTFLLKLENKDLTLCDCPGLVFPNLASSKSEMFCNGILPIDHMRDPVGPMSYLIRKIPRIVLESVYGMRLPVPDVLEEGRLPFPHEVMREYGQLRGFMTTRGTPDENRASRLMLKDFVNGKLLYVKPPPDYKGEEFNPICEKYMQRIVSSAAKVKKSTITLAKEDVENNFFRPRDVKMMTNGRKTPADWQKDPEAGPKPWKKHFKGNVKVKTRIKAADLNY